uniref:Uncharacterized protein n=1 Tax=Thermogemmatispora argillosa TaxID=2045280 RepID=A0A455SZ59_9CHLR|nr:hypothetical protein KTA_10370 [Thermogemmatispora argillosa]
MFAQQSGKTLTCLIIAMTIFNEQAVASAASLPAKEKKREQSAPLRSPTGQRGLEERDKEGKADLTPAHMRWTLARQRLLPTAHAAIKPAPVIE